MGGVLGPLTWAGGWDEASDSWSGAPRPRRVAASPCGPATLILGAAPHGVQGGGGRRGVGGGGRGARPEAPAHPSPPLPGCERDRLAFGFCETLRLLGRCQLPAVRTQCCRSCSPPGHGAASRGHQRVARR